MLKIKRVYDPPEAADGFRILVDRLWPRGLSKEKAAAGLRLRDIAPSDALRKWFGHDPVKWIEFQSRYRKELAGKKDLLQQIHMAERGHGTVTLLFAAHDEEHNNAAALKLHLGKRKAADPPKRRAGK